MGVKHHIFVKMFEDISKKSWSIGSNLSKQHPLYRGQIPRTRDSEIINAVLHVVVQRSAKVLVRGLVKFVPAG